MDTFAVEQFGSVMERVAQRSRASILRTVFGYTGLRHSATALAVASDDPSPPNIMDVINKSKKAPSSTSIAAVPATIGDMDLENLRSISLLDTYISVTSAIYLYKSHPQDFNITTPEGAADFTKRLSNARLRVITQGLAGVLSLGDSTAFNYTQRTTSVDLHLEFLAKIFGSFGFTPAALKQLDGLLTNIVNNLRNLQMRWSDTTQTLDHLISVYYFEPVLGLDVKVPKIRLFFLHIDQKSWTIAVGKSSATRFSFSMNYSDQIATMSLTQMAESRQTIQDYVTLNTNKSLDDIQKLVGMAALDQKDASD